MSYLTKTLILLYFLAYITNGGAEVFTTMEEIFPTDQVEIQNANNKPLVIKNENGTFNIFWPIFQEFNKDTKKLGKNLKKVINKNINLKGFMIPTDYAAKRVSTFLFVPYVPTCAHVPPPPASMIIEASLNSKINIKPTYWPIQVSGKLFFKKTKGQTIDPYMPEGSFALSVNEIKELKQ